VKIRILKYLRLFAAIVICTLPLAAQEFDEAKWGQNSAGVELRAIEGPRDHDASGTILVYNLAGKGFPPDLHYSLWGWIPGHKPQKAIDGVSFDKRGVLVCTGKPGYCPATSPDDPINIKTTAVLGEPKRFAVVSNDGRVAGFAEAVPFPIEATSGKCKISVIRQSPLAELVLVRASGFVPYEMLTVSGHVGGLDSIHSPTVSPDGVWQAMIGTKAPGQDSGTATIKVAGQACSVSISFQWGDGTAKEQ
jgi:hypothetical protein